MSISIDTLKSIKVFSDLDVHHLNQITAYFSEKFVEKGQIFLFEGEQPEHLYFIVSGFVKMYDYSSHGQEFIVDILKKGDIANISSTFSDHDQLANAVAVTPVLLYLIKKDDFKYILQNYPGTVINALKVLADMVYRAWSLAHDISFELVIQRLAKILLKINEAESEWPRLTQSEMAAMIGTSRKAVNHALKILEDKRAITINRKGVTINNPCLLKTLCSGAQ